MAEDSQVWKQYVQEKGQRPKNASQLMKWSKKTDHSRNLSFSQAKKIFNVKSKEPIEEKTDINSVKKSNVDMTAEKEELKEYISECKEELVSLQNRELSMEDNYYEGNEGLETQFEQLENLLKTARDKVINQRKKQYETIVNGIKSQKETLEDTLRILRKKKSSEHQK
eukprot:414090_1